MVKTTLCIGCRAVTDAPACEADRFGPFEGWKKFTCTRCGVLDVRPGSEENNDD